MATRPAAPAIPAPTTPVGSEAPPLDVEALAAELEAPVVEAVDVVSLVPDEVAVAEVVPLLYFPVVVALTEDPEPVPAAPVGTAAPWAVRK